MMVATRVLQTFEVGNHWTQIENPNGGSARWQTIIEIDPNEVFGDAAFGDYVVVAHFNIAKIDSTIATPSPHVEVTVAPQIQSAGGTIRYGDHAHVQTFWGSQSGAFLTPSVNTDRAVPVFLVHHIGTITDAVRWSLVASVRCPQWTQQLDAQGLTPRSAAVLENVSVTVCSLSRLAAAGVAYRIHTGSTGPIGLTPSVASVLQAPLEGSVSGEAWAAFWRLRLTPGPDPVAPPGRMPFPALAALGVRDAGGTVRTYNMRGFGRRYPAVGPDVDVFEVGGVTWHEFAADAQGFEVLAQDPGSSWASHGGTIFAVEASALHGHGATERNLGVAHPIYARRRATDADGYRLSFVGDRFQGRVFWCETAASVLLGAQHDGVSYALEPGYPWAEPLAPRPNRTYVCRALREAMPDYRTGHTQEAPGTNELILRGLISEGAYPPGGGSGLADELLELQELSVISLAEFIGIETPTSSAEVVGAPSFVSLTRETLDASQLPPLPSEPIGVAPLVIEDLHGEMTALAGDPFSWPLMTRVRKRWDLTFGWSEKLRPGLTARWHDFVAGPNVLAVAWRSPLDSTPAAHVLDLSAASLSGPVAGVWSLGGVVAYRMEWTGAPEE